MADIKGKVSAGIDKAAERLSKRNQFALGQGLIPEYQYGIAVQRLLDRADGVLVGLRTEGNPACLSHEILPHRIEFKGHAAFLLPVKYQYRPHGSGMPTLYPDRRFASAPTATILSA